MQLLEQIKKEIKPQAGVFDKLNESINNINANIKKNSIKAICVAGGSVAKGTFLKDDFDIDLFVCFDDTYENEDISLLLEKILKDYSVQKVHGSRDYFQFKKDKLNFEIVPVLNVKNPKDAKNVTDMSPMHVNWVKKNLKKDQDDEIRLTKKFCKAIGVYGAESYIHGFSGHIIDILIIYYGSFINLLKASAKWKPQVIIDIQKHFKNSREILFNINLSKIQGPLIVIDPILKTRNAASALSHEKFSLFKKKAKEFLKNPDKKYFKETVIGKTYLKIKHKGKKLCIIDLKSKNGKKDVVGSKILKSFKFLKTELKKKGFELMDSGWSWNKKFRVLFWFILKDDMIPDTKIIPGPPIDMKEPVLVFKKIYKKTFVQEEKIFAEIPNKITSVEKNILQISNKEYFSSKIKLLKIEKYK